MSRLNSTTRRQQFISNYKQEIAKLNIEFGTCFCGCGGKTTISDGTDYKANALLDFPRQYICGHGTKISGPEYIEEDRGHATMCWIWRLGKTTTSHGGYYGIARRNPGDLIPVNAHIVMWERHRGSVSEGLELDHLCRQTLCVNPDHLEPVTHEENVRRGVVSRGLAKLSRDEAVAVIKMRISGASFKAIGSKFGIRSDYAQAVCYGQKVEGCCSCQ